MTHEHGTCQKRCSTVSAIFLSRSIPENEPEAPEVLHLPHRIIIMPKNKSDDSFRKRDFDPSKNVVQVHQVLRLLRKITSKTASHFDPGLSTIEQRAENATPATQMKNCPRCLHDVSKTRPWEETSRRHQICASLCIRNAPEYLTGEHFGCKSQQKQPTCMKPPRMNTKLFP